MKDILKRQSLNVIAAVLFFPALANAEAVPSTGYNDPNGYYNTDGTHQNLNANPALHGTATPTDPQVFNQAIAEQTKTLTQKPGETSDQLAIRQARIPTSLVPEPRPQVVDNQLGLDEKLVDAARLAGTGYNAATSTSTQLMLDAMNQTIAASANGAGADAQQAASNLWQEYTNMVGVAGTWKQAQASYLAGKDELVQNYEKTPSGTSAAPTRA